MKIILGIILFIVGSLLIKTAEESVLEPFSDAEEPQETEGDDEAPEIGKK